MAPLALILAAIVVAGPGESVAQAVAAARDGDKVVVRGAHRENVLVTRAIELVGEDGAILEGDRKTSVLTIRASGVRVRDLSVRGSGDSLLREDSGVVVEGARGVVLERLHVDDALFGIHVKNSPETLIRECTVRGRAIHVAQRGDGIRVYASARSRVERCTVEETRDVILWFSEGSTFLDNHVRHARYGLHLMNTADATCERNVIEDASVGIFSMYSNQVHVRANRVGPVRGPSGYGIGLKDTDAFVVEGNLIGDARVGFFFDQSPLDPAKPGVVLGNHVAWCDISLSFMPSTHDVTFAKNAFVENGVQVEIRGGGKLRGNSFERDGRGNYWSDYDGFDADGDGVGETPYRSMNLYEALVDAHPDLKIFEGGMSARAIDWGARVVPLVAPDPKVEDEHPLVAPPALPHVPGGVVPRGSSFLATVGAILLTLGAGACVRLGRSL